MDGITFAAIEAAGLEKWLAGPREKLISKTYRPDPVRPLGIPTIRDRVIQTAAKIVLEPIFEADFEDSAYGYRPARGAVDAVKEVHPADLPGLYRRFDADLSRYLDPVRLTLTALGRVGVSEVRIGTKKRTFRSNKKLTKEKRCAALLKLLTKKAPYKGPGADSPAT